MCAAGLVEQPLQRAGGDAPSLLRDVARSAAASVCSLRLKILASEIDEAWVLKVAA
jgi:hypothetical protein